MFSCHFKTCLVTSEHNVRRATSTDIPHIEISLIGTTEYFYIITPTSAFKLVFSLWARLRCLLSSSNDLNHEGLLKLLKILAHHDLVIVGLLDNELQTELFDEKQVEMRRIMERL